MIKNYNAEINIFFILLIIFNIGCNDVSVFPKFDENQKKPNEYDSLKFSNEIQLSTNPTFGSFQTTFKINLLINDTTLKINQVKYDFTNDNNYDTSFTLLDTVRTRFTKFGYNKIIASVYFENDSVLSCSTDVWLTEPKPISADGHVYFEPNIYNGNFISVTHGYRHQAIFFDLKTYKMECFFCDFSSNSFTEMHISMPSFDGRKLLFDNGGQGYLFCYYDLQKNDKTTIDVPLNVTNYTIGQITWSLDNKNIYAVTIDKNYVPNGIKSYNIETQQVSTIYDKGNYICIVPDHNEELAILETITDSTSKIIIYNLTAKTVEKEYNNIPFNAPFRLLHDSDRIYFDGTLSFYSLSTGKIYTMRFDEIDYHYHDPYMGEADITMDGSKFILGTWDTNPMLYIITLPTYF